MDNGGTIQGGFTDENGRGAGNRSEFNIIFGNGDTGETLTFRTDITSGADTVSGTSFIFAGLPSGGAFNFFQIDNRDTNPSQAALYDVRISAVPVPAAGGLLLLALGGMGLARRRKTA